MTWFWMNIPLGVVFVAAWSGIPLWLVLRHPDRGPGPPGIRYRADAGEPAQPRTADASGRQHASDSRPRADAHR